MVNFRDRSVCDTDSMSVYHHRSDVAQRRTIAHSEVSETAFAQPSTAAILGPTKEGVCMKRSLKALAVAAPVVTLSGWMIIHSPAGSTFSSERSIRGQTDGVEPGRLRRLPAGPPIYAPGTFGDSVPRAERIGDMMLEVVPDSAGPQRPGAIANPEGHDFTGRVI